MLNQSHNFTNLNSGITPLFSIVRDVLAKDANGPVLNYWNQYAFKIIWSDIWIIDLNLNSWLQAWGVQNPKKLQLR